MPKTRFDEITTRTNQDRDGYTVFVVDIWLKGERVDYLSSWQSHRKATEGAAAWARKRGEFVGKTIGEGGKTIGETTQALMDGVCPA
jgi:hypothetical protein